MSSPFQAATDPAEPSRVFDVVPADGDAKALVFASPHSGRWRPGDMGEVANLSQMTLRSAEDVGVDALIGGGPSRGVPLISGQVSRTYVDLNRAAEELDAELIAGLPATTATAKVAAGYGVIPRKAGDGTDLYDRRLSLAEARLRLESVHAPYHQALEALIEAARVRHGFALLIDWHSMPSRAVGGVMSARGRRGVDVILGDRHGSSCRGGVTRRVRALLEAQGWRVGLNTPYAGGYSTARWGRPDEGFQAIQIELNRALYLDEATLEPSSDYGRVAKALDRVIAGLAAETWPR